MIAINKRNINFVPDLINVMPIMIKGNIRPGYDS